MTQLGRSRKRTSARGWIALAALLSVFLQAFLVQTHVHALSAPIGVVHAQANAPSSDASAGETRASAAHDQTLCVICQALAASGRATLPDAASVTRHANIAHASAPHIIRDAPRTVAHSWRSRAPPIAL